MTMTEIVFAVSESNPDCRRFRFETSTRPKLLAKSRATKAPTDFTVEIRSSFTACLGVNYETEVNDVLESQGLTRDFESQKPSGKHYVNGTNWLMESDSAPGRFYAALCRFEDRTSEYLINGVPATPEQIEDLKANYLPKPGAKKLVEWKTYSIESITSVTPA